MYESHILPGLRPISTENRVWNWPGRQNCLPYFYNQNWLVMTRQELPDLSRAGGASAIFLLHSVSADSEALVDSGQESLAHDNGPNLIKE